jgi:glycerophosphoryl diester phosphodiesterase
VDDEAHAARLLARGVDAVITDRPDIMVPFVRGREAARREPQMTATSE